MRYLKHGFKKIEHFCFGDSSTRFKRISEYSLKFLSSPFKISTRFDPDDLSSRAGTKLFTIDTSHIVHNCKQRARNGGEMPSYRNKCPRLRVISCPLHNSINYICPTKPGCWWEFPPKRFVSRYDDGVHRTRARIFIRIISGWQGRNARACRSCKARNEKFTTNHIYTTECHWTFYYIGVRIYVFVYTRLSSCQPCILYEGRTIWS